MTTRTQTRKRKASATGVDSAGAAEQTPVAITRAEIQTERSKARANLGNLRARFPGPLGAFLIGCQAFWETSILGPFLPRGGGDKWGAGQLVRDFIQLDVFTVAALNIEPELEEICDRAGLMDPQVALWPPHSGNVLDVAVRHAALVRQKTMEFMTSDETIYRPDLLSALGIPHDEPYSEYPDEVFTHWRTPPAELEPQIAEFLSRPTSFERAQVEAGLERMRLRLMDVPADFGAALGRCAERLRGGVTAPNSEPTMASGMAPPSISAVSGTSTPTDVGQAPLIASGRRTCPERCFAVLRTLRDQDVGTGKRYGLYADEMDEQVNGSFQLPGEDRIPRSSIRNVYSKKVQLPDDIQKVGRGLLIAVRKVERVRG